MRIPSNWGRVVPTAHYLYCVFSLCSSKLSFSSSLASILTELIDVPSEHEVLLLGDVPMDIPNQLPLWRLALAGGVATMIGDAALHPMDCIKTLQQNDGLNACLFC